MNQQNASLNSVVNYLFHIVIFHTPPAFPLYLSYHYIFPFFDSEIIIQIAHFRRQSCHLY
jgi:hypothetical protein